MLTTEETGSGVGRRKVNKYACGCVIVASMVSVLFGYDAGVMSGAMMFIKEELSINDGNLEVLAGILNMFALLGSLCAGRISDLLGRKYTVMLASVIFMTGSLIMGYAPNYSVLMLGRCTAGVGVGFSLMIAPVYAAEISSASTRGFLASLPEIGISVGILLGYISNNVFANLSLKLGWRMMLGVPALPSFLLAIAVLRLTESPRWLMMKGRVGEAKIVLCKICNDEREVEERLEDMKTAVGIDKTSKADVAVASSTGVWKDLILRPTPTVRRMLIAGVGLHFFLHGSGLESLILYGPRIFKKAGLQGTRNLLFATIGVGLTKMIFIIVSTYFIDKLGRRKLLFISISGMIAMMMGLATCMTVIEHVDDKLLWTLVLSLIFVYGFQVFFSVGIGSVCWVYSSEIYPLNLRAAGASIGVAMNRIMSAAVAMTFLSLTATLGYGGTFFLFAGITLVGWIFVYFCVPETMGRSLEEMEQVFSER